MAAASTATDAAAPRPLSRDLAIQIHRALADAPFSSSSSTRAEGNQAPSTPAASDSRALPWSEPQPLEAQLDQLLVQHQPVTLQSLASVHERLRNELQDCQQSIDTLSQQLQRETDADRMAKVQKAIAALLEQLNLIREKARESENVVKEITRDIRSLDVAKRNVVASMTALKRLQMLVNGVDQLERLTETKRYREAASALQAVKALLDFFQSYKGVERIAAAWKQVNDLQTQLRTSAMQDYEHFFLHDAGRSVRASSLADAALVLDAVGADARNALIDWYCALQLREYRRIFRATDEAGQLDNVSRRFAWFRRVLKVHEDEHAPAFLKAWQVERWLVRKFAEITREDLQSVLIREQGRLNVATLLEALNATLDFESAMSKTFGSPFEDIVAPTPNQVSATAGGTGATMNSQPNPAGKSLSSVFDPHLIVFVEAQDRTLAEMFQNYRRQGASLDGNNGEGRRSAGFGAEGLYGSSNGGGAGEQDGTGSAAGGGAGGGAGIVLPSSTEMFYFYRQTLEQCARLSNREPFNELYNVYRKWLRIYADDVLRAALVRHDAPSAARRSIDVRPNLADLQKWCLVLNTADYCASTSSQLEDKVKEKIHPDFRDGVSLDEERGIFTTLISYAVQTLAREFEICSEAIWSAMLRPPAPPNGRPWNQVQQPGPPSGYVQELSSLLEQVGVVVRQDVENKRFVRSWCDKVVAVVVGRFTNVVVRLRPLSRAVVEQLLVDLAEIRKRLDALPRYPADDGWGVPASAAVASAAASYRRYVAKTTGRVDALLRIVMAPTTSSAQTTSSAPTSNGDSNAAVSQDNQGQPSLRAAGVVDDGRETDLITLYRRTVSDRSYANFQKVLELKGLRKVEANELLDRLLNAQDEEEGAQRGDGEQARREEGANSLDASMAGGPELAAWLSKLDMDVHAHPPSILSSPFDGSATPPTRSSLNLSLSGSGTIVGRGSGEGGGGAAGSVASGLAAAAHEGTNVAASGAGRALSDLRRFGSMFGAALGAGRREEGRR